MLALCLSRSENAYSTCTEFNWKRKKLKQNFTGRKVSGFTLEQEIIILLWSLVLSELWIYENEHDLRSRMNNLSGWKRTWKNSGLTGNRTLTFVMTGRNALSIELINHVFIRRSKYDSFDIFQLISCLLVYESFYCCLPWPGNFFFSRPLQDGCHLPLSTGNQYHHTI